MHKILDKIKNESYFRWPNKMGGVPTKHNQSLHCQYHQDRGYTTEECRTLRNHLKQLVKFGKLNNSYISPVDKAIRQGRELRKMLLQDLIWGQSTLFLLPQVGPIPICPR